MDAAYLIAALAPSHALHGASEEVTVDIGKRVRCACGADLTFSPMQVATLLLLDTPAEPPQRAQKEESRGS